MKNIFLILIFLSACEMENVTVLSLCEEQVLKCFDTVDGGGESLDYLRGEFCGCLGSCFNEFVKADLQGDLDNVDTEVVLILKAAKCIPR